MAPEGQENMMLGKACIWMFCQEILKEEIHRPELHSPEEKETDQIPEALPGHDGILGDTQTLKCVCLHAPRTAAGAAENGSNSKVGHEKADEEEAFSKDIFQEKSSRITGHFFGLAGKEQDLGSHHDGQYSQNFQNGASCQKLKYR